MQQFLWWIYIKDKDTTSLSVKCQSKNIVLIMIKITIPINKILLLNYQIHANVAILNESTEVANISDCNVDTITPYFYQHITNNG